MAPADVIKLAKQKNVQFVDLRFMDFPGLWQHTTCPITELTLGSFDTGFGFDGSSIRGWQAINESDMLLIPVPETARLDPFLTHPTPPPQLAGRTARPASSLTSSWPGPPPGACGCWSTRPVTPADGAAWFWRCSLLSAAVCSIRSTTLRIRPAMSCSSSTTRIRVVVGAVPPVGQADGLGRGV